MAERGVLDKGESLVATSANISHSRHSSRARRCNS